MISALTIHILIIILQIVICVKSPTKIVLICLGFTIGCFVCNLILLFYNYKNKRKYKKFIEENYYEDNKI